MAVNGLNNVRILNITATSPASLKKKYVQEWNDETRNSARLMLQENHEQDETHIIVTHGSLPILLTKVKSPTSQTTTVAEQSRGRLSYQATTSHDHVYICRRFFEILEDHRRVGAIVAIYRGVDLSTKFRGGTNIHT
jgi:hypothetical protein